MNTTSMIRAAARLIVAAITGLAAQALLSLPSFAISPQNDTCRLPDCEVVAAVHTTEGQRGALTLVDEKGRRWSLPRIEHAPAASIGFPSDWSDENAISAAYERYLAALDNNDAPILRTSADGRYHLCIRAGRVECIYVPAK